MVDVLMDHPGVHVVFMSEGTSGELDSDAHLFIMDVDSQQKIKCDGTVLQKGQKYMLHPGSTVEVGEGASYAVLRNVHAHA